jgi:hypothetical protein
MMTAGEASPPGTGLGRFIALFDCTPPSEIGRLEPSVLGDPGEHSRPDFLPIVKREHTVRPSGAREGPV